ncbi:FG-GAP repeat domain-containing protein [Rhodohalobacter halophilus]|uniref:FG-GAP repeat domain-containing protein n=1 Tax=Rhodohalobacter halophilus TaxID=1812810 RepID=UPI0009FE84EB|nr:VCBS repeat-containing protein [Rhodohalobacter halophilus]
MNHWTELVPGDTPFVLVPEQNTAIFDLLEAQYTPLLDDMTPSAIQLINYVDEEAPGETSIQAVLFYPDMANDWQPVWISNAPSNLFGRLTAKHQKRFEQNRYLFNGYTIEKLFLDDRVLFVITLGDYFIFSESSLGIENMIRTLTGEDNPINLLPEEAAAGSFIVNTVSLESWVKQVAQVTYRPHLANMFTGGSPLVFRMDSTNAETESWRMSAAMNLGENRSPLLRSISSEERGFTLDRYIPVNSAAFSIQRLQPRSVPPEEYTPETDTDRFIEQNLSVWQDIAAELDSEFAFATFAESGAESTSEYLYLRKISSASTIRSALNELVQEDLIIRDGNTYSIQSSWLARLFGSELNPMIDFYVTVYDEVAAIASRKGLVESIGGDANRRRVMYYDDDFMEIKETISESVSSIFYMNARAFDTYIQPWLYPQNYLSTLLSPLDQLVITTELESPDRLTVQIHSFERESIDQPYRERWIFPLGGAEITGPSVLADITGSSRNEVIFSTNRGNVFALAADGTTVLEASTGDDTPIGAPVVYDWYGNNQNVILQAAGNKVYAWNNSGALLPNFPISLDENITTPLTVEDITRNGVAELVVGTNDRNLHILNSRGRALNGWPQSTNATIDEPPFIGTYEGERSIFTYSENTLHAWSINGERRNGFPVFLPAQIYGAPSKFKEHIVGAGYDGSLYAIGTNALFADSLSVTHASDSLFVQSIQISNTTLNATPSSHNLMLRVDDELVRDDFVLIQSSNGSLFLYDDTGRLVVTQTMGQPSSNSFAPLISDIDRDQRMDLVALASFGRLYAWDVVSGARILDLPTTGMNHPIIQDVTGDGNIEIIAQTRDGLRSWTILEVRKEGESN